MSVKTIIKKPREDDIPDIPINFPELYNLKLNLLEDKVKLKPGLPLIPLSHTEKIPEKKIEPFVNTSDRQETPRLVNNSVKEVKNVIRENESRDKLENIRSSVDREDEDEDDKELFEEVGEKDDYDNDIIEDENYDEDDTDRSSSKEEIKDYDPYEGLSPEEREEKEREEYIWRFRILKKKYHNTASISIPEYNEHSDLPMMKKSYERTIKELYLDDAVENYKTYLLGGFLAIEYVCTSIIGVDLEGFTMQQVQMMHKYDTLLIELGEKSYSTVGSNLPVEIRLLFMMLVQAALFFAAKYVSQEHGSHIGDMIRSVTGMAPEPVKNSENGTGETKKKMRGPKTKASDIRNRMDNT